MLASGVRTYMHILFCYEVSMAEVHVILLSCLLSNTCYIQAHMVTHNEGEHGVVVTG